MQKAAVSGLGRGWQLYFFVRNIEFKKMTIPMQKKKTRALCTVFFSALCLTEGVRRSGRD